MVNSRSSGIRDSFQADFPLLIQLYLASCFKFWIQALRTISLTDVLSTELSSLVPSDFFFWSIFIAWSTDLHEKPTDKHTKALCPRRHRLYSQIYVPDSLYVSFPYTGTHTYLFTPWTMTPHTSLYPQTCVILERGDRVYSPEMSLCTHTDLHRRPERDLFPRALVLV